VAVEVVLPITLGQFVKLAGLADTGGDAKRVVTEGQVRVNGETDTRRGHKLAPGDIVEVGGEAAEVVVRAGVPRVEGPISGGPSAAGPERPPSSRD
jgi:ribosome-associated protein